MTFDIAQAPAATLVAASDAARSMTLVTAPNGLRYATLGDTGLAAAELTRVVAAVPAVVAAALSGYAFYFVPLALPETRPATRGEARRSAPDTTLVATGFTAEMAEEAICHRNVSLPAQNGIPAHEGIFLSARLLRDTFGLAFELFINIGHAFVTRVGVPERFLELAWDQATANVKGETSQDAWESRLDALKPLSAGSVAPDEKFKTEFFETAFADTLAIYQLSLAVDFDYAELREREYPLLAPGALADRLRLVAQMFPPNEGYEFSIRYRRR